MAGGTIFSQAVNQNGGQIYTASAPGFTPPSTQAPTNPGGAPGNPQGALNPNYNPKAAPGTAGSLEPTVVSSTNIDQKNQDNTQKVMGTPPTGQTAGTDGYIRNADQSFAEAPSTATPVIGENGQQTWPSGGMNYALGNSGGKVSQDRTIQGLYDQFIQLKGQMDATGAANIENIKQQFESLIKQQAAINKGDEASTYSILARGGSLQTDSSGGIIASQISSGLGKIADLTSKENAAVIAAQQAMQDNDYKLLDKQLTIASDARKERQDAAQKMVDDIKSAKATAQANADKQRAYQLEVDKFKQTGDQNAFDNAFKMEQQKYSEQKDAQTAAETKRHNKVTEGIDAFKAGMGAGGSNNLGVTQSAVGFNGVADPASQKATLDQISQKYGPMTAIAIKGLADYSINPTDWSTRFAKGMNRETAVTLAKMVDPNYSDAEYTMRNSMKKNITSGNYSQTITSANTLIQHLAKLKGDIDSLGNTGVFGTAPFGLPGLNALKNAGMNLAGSGKTTAVMTDINAVASEAAKVYKGVGAPSEKEIADWKATIGPNMSPDQAQKSIQSLIDLMAGKLSTVSDNYHGVMGQPLGSFGGGFQILTDRNAQTLQKMGIDPASVDPTYGNSPTMKLQSFYTSDPKNASLIDQLVQADPSLKADPAKMMQTLFDNGISL